MDSPRTPTFIELLCFLALNLLVNLFVLFCGNVFLIHLLLLEESVAFSSSDLSKIGTIKLEVEYVRPQSMAAEFPPESFDNSNIKLSERTKKGGGHCCTLGDESETFFLQGRAFLTFFTQPR
jgi:hypothetical protein